MLDQRDRESFCDVCAISHRIVVEVANSLFVNRGGPATRVTLTFTAARRFRWARSSALHALLRGAQHALIHRDQCGLLLLGQSPVRGDRLLDIRDIPLARLGLLALTVQQAGMG